MQAPNGLTLNHYVYRLIPLAFLANMSRNNGSERGISILVGDSGGAGGLSTAAALDQLMKRVQEEERLSYTPLVEDYFDIVAGAGTGAITMTLTGRLGMTTEQAMECFAQLSSEVFSDEKLIGAHAFKASKMEKALKDIVRKKAGDENEPMMDGRSKDRKCKTIVFARSAHNMNAGIPTIFRSYHTVTNPSPNCTIWQALRATTAHPEMFKSIEIEEHGISQPYVDAAMGCGNPIEHVLAEARALYPDRKIACIVSIGAGHARTIRIPEPSLLGRVLPVNVIVAMRDIATDNEQTAQTMAGRFRGVPDVYFRLNVDQGIQDVRLGHWDRLGEIMAHTRAYMQKVETSELMKRAARTIMGREGVILATRIDGEIHMETMLQTTGVKECPAPTSFYIERHKPIQQAINCLTSNTRDRRVFVFHGLGGAGKTQLALQTVERTRNHWSDVIYIDATSAETLTSTLKGFATARAIGETHEDAIRWLGAYTERWLLVLDNADDASLDLRQYLPKGTQGRILITTRSRDVALLAQGPESAYNVSGMEPEEALSLLLTVSKTSEEISPQEKDAATSLVQDLGWLALGVVQAGAYIWRTSCGFAQYREMYARRPREILEKYSHKPLELDGYEKTVYGTWTMSYELLSERAQKLLWLVAYLQRDRITQEMFQRAAAGAKDFETALPLTGADKQALADVKEYLSDLLLGDKWDPSVFLETMSEIMSYSLISYDRVNESYVLHVLVQGWIHTVIPHSPERALAQSSFLLALSIDYGQEVRDYAYRRALELHVTNLLRHHTEANQHTSLKFGYIMRESGQYEKAKILQTQVLRAYERTLGDDAKKTLAARGALALTYFHQGLYKQAEALQVQVLEMTKQVSVNEHPDTLASMGDLALTYSYQGLYKQAETLEVQVLEARKRVSGNEHPDTLTSMNNLAITYSAQGLYKQAETLQVQVLEASKRVSGNEHPYTLGSMNNLAITYSRQALYSQAETLQVQVLEASKRVLGNEHPDTLTSMANLAGTYSDQGLYKQAETLQVQVLEARKRVLGNEHPRTLISMNNLALTYTHQGLYSQAETLQVQVLEASKRVLGNEHPDTLLVMHSLAVTYSKQRLYQQAETLHVQAIEGAKRTLGTQHPHTLRYMKKLVITYECMGWSHRPKRKALEAEIAKIDRSEAPKLRKLFGLFRV